MESGVRGVEGWGSSESTLGHRFVSFSGVTSYQHISKF